MREILFRGKRLDNDEWVEGYYSGYGLICQNEPEDTYNATGDYRGQTPYVGFVEVDPATICQSTGLRDVDGKRIFEGDVLELVGCDDDPNHIEHHVVIWYQNGWHIRYSDCTPVVLDEFDVVDYAEVIGNIHDNPEYLYKEG